MRVRFFAYIRNLTGCAEADFPYRETAGALARTLCETYGDKLRQKFFPPGNSVETPGEEKFGPEIIFLINGRHIGHLGGSAAPLKPDDRVDIFPVVAGG
jgi:molybdopterin synthase sulfur carrier subunit